MIKKNDKLHEQVLIKWQGLTIEEATWERYTDMQRQYPNFNLEDKVIFQWKGTMITEKVDTWGANEN